jgi:hypothetical protein
VSVEVDSTTRAWLVVVGAPVQQGVPQRVMVAFSSLMRANPKSATLTFQFSSTSRLEGFRSRWTMTGCREWR